MSDENLLRDLVSGLITAHLITLETLIANKSVNRDDLIREFQEMLDTLKAEPAAPVGAQLPLQHLIRGLGLSNAPAQRRGWLPLVIEGGAGTEDQ